VGRDPTTPRSELIPGLLAVAFDQLVAPDAETGIAELAARAGRPAPAVAWHAAVVQAVADGLIHDPVRLPPGALQCHWRLELTPAGFAEARRVREAGNTRPV